MPNVLPGPDTFYLMCFDTSKLAMMIGFHIIGYLFVELPFEMLNVHRLQH